MTATPTPPDRRDHRAWLASQTKVPAGGTAVDLGCGRGDELRLLAVRYPDPSTRFIGIDHSGAGIASAAVANTDPRVSFRQASLDGRLPFSDASLDLVYSHNLLECLPDPGAFAREVARVLRPGGQVVVAHWDWDTQLFDGSDKALIRRLVTAYADWQQDWMPHADSWMGRRLRGVFDTTDADPAFDGAVQARVLTNTVFAPPWFGYENAQALHALTKRGLASPADVERFLAEQASLHERGRYFYSITGFVYVGTRIGASSAARRFPDGAISSECER